MSSFEEKKRYLIDKSRKYRKVDQILSLMKLFKMISTVKQIESDVKKLFVLHKECKNAQIKVIEPLQHLSDKFDEMERGNNKKDEQISKL